MVSKIRFLRFLPLFFCAALCGVLWDANADNVPTISPIQNNILTGPADGAGVSEAAQALLYDMETDTVLLEKDASVEMAPSSMTKVLLVYMIFEKLHKGEIRLDDLFSVSEKAWRMGGSKMFVGLNTQISIRDLLKGIIVQSGNDACIVLTEGLSGSEEAFSVLMNKKAKILGAQKTHFLNSTGWPEGGHRSTAWDILLFGVRTIRDFPDLYATYYKETTFTYNGIRQTNRNPLFYKNLGDGILSDGLKTGHTDEGGFGFLGSAIKGTRRLIFVIHGLPNNKSRSLAAERLVKYGMSHFEVVCLFPENSVVDTATLPAGDIPSVPLITQAPIKITIRRGKKEAIKTKVQLLDVPLPIGKGQLLAELVVSSPEFSDKKFPLFAGEAVKPLGASQKIWITIKSWFATLLR